MNVFPAVIRKNRTPGSYKHFPIAVIYYTAWYIYDIKLQHIRQDCSNLLFFCNCDTISASMLIFLYRGRGNVAISSWHVSTSCWRGKQINAVGISVSIQGKKRVLKCVRTPYRRYTKWGLTKDNRVSCSLKEEKFINWTKTKQREIILKRLMGQPK